MNRENQLTENIIVLIRCGSNDLSNLFESLVNLFKKKYQTQMETGILKSSLQNDDYKEYILYK